MTDSKLRTIAIALLAALAGALVLAAVVLLAGGDGNAPIQIMLPTPDEELGKAGLESGPAPRSPEVESELKVDIRGAVRNPDVYTLFPGARLEDAVNAAGGVTDEADKEAMHLSRRVQDQGYYYIHRIGETPRPAVEVASFATAPGAGGSNGLIDLNAAPVELLQGLPGIGEALAKAIVDYRDQNGPFRSILEITNVPRIGPATYAKIQGLVTVTSPP